MKNLIIAFIFLAVMAHLSFAKEKKTNFDDYSALDVENPPWANQTAQYNQVNSTQQNATKTKNKWDFSDHSQETKKPSETLKKQKYTQGKQEYRKPKKWEPKKSLTTNNITTDKVADH